MTTNLASLINARLDVIEGERQFMAEHGGRTEAQVEATHKAVVAQMLAIYNEMDKGQKVYVHDRFNGMDCTLSGHIVSKFMNGEYGEFEVYWDNAEHNQACDEWKAEYEMEGCELRHVAHETFFYADLSWKKHVSQSGRTYWTSTEAMLS